MSAKQKYFSLSIFVAAASLYLVYYVQINHGFSQLYGDKYDAVIESILESHWFEFLKGNQGLLTPTYFYPYPDVLGYGDALFIYGLIHSVFRVLGVNILVANELTTITVRAIGFFSMAAFLGVLECRASERLLGAALFTIWLSASVHAGHAQMQAVSFAPLLTYLLWKSKKSLEDGRNARAFSFLAAFAVLYGLFLLNSFYMAWYFGLFTVLFVIATIFINLDETRSLVKHIASARKQLWPILVLIPVVLYPLLRVYLPVLHQTGGRSLDMQMSFALNPLDFLNAGWYSIVWHDVFDWLYQIAPALRHDAYEAIVGFTPDVALAAFVAAIYALCKKDRFLISLSVALVVSLLLPVAINGRSLWLVVDRIVPGAMGMRVIGRFYLFLAFPLVVLVAVFLSRVPRAVSIAVFVLLCTSQVNRFPATNLDARAEMAQLASVPAPPSECRSFYVTGSPDTSNQTERIYSHNVLAMLIADRFEVPTINGMAAFWPPDWTGPYDDGYKARVARYIEAHHLRDVCAYDLQTSKWN